MCVIPGAHKALSHVQGHCAHIAAVDAQRPTWLPFTMASPSLGIHERHQDFHTIATQQEPQALYRP
jgi:hypothetical protein